MITSIRQGLDFVRTHDARTVWREFNRRDNRHPLVQLSKYLVCGVVAVVIHNTVFALLGWSGLLPHFADQGQPDGKRALFFALASLGGFLASDVFAYLSNVSWVFEGGRHHPFKEFSLFTAVASIGFFVGLSFGLWEILRGSGSSWMASIMLVLTAAAVNFLCRKFIIFKG